MLSFETARHRLPLLAVTQAQKELTHNEALMRIDALLHPLIVDERTSPPALTDVDIGKCWLVGNSASSEWFGKSGQIAIWIGGGWRFCNAADGMRIRIQADATDRIRSNGIWIAAVSIANPANGSVIDNEARAAIIALLEYLRLTGQVTV
jgi:hypothetical protein